MVSNRVNKSFMKAGFVIRPVLYCFKVKRCECRFSFILFYFWWWVGKFLKVGGFFRSFGV